MPDELTILLDNYNANTLREMAEANDMSTLGEDGKRLTKDQLLSKMRTQFFTPKRILASYQRLSKTERAALDRLLLRGGQASKRRFKRELIRAGLAVEAQEPKRQAGYYSHSEIPYDDGYIGYPTRPNSNVFEDIIARLTYRGLVFSRGGEMNLGGSPYKLRFHPAGELYIPHVIQEALPRPDPIEETIAELQPAETFAADPTLFLRDLYFIGILRAAKRLIFWLAAL